MLSVVSVLSVDSFVGVSTIMILTLVLLVIECHIVPCLMLCQWLLSMSRGQCQQGGDCFSKGDDNVSRVLTVSTRWCLQGGDSISMVSRDDSSLMTLVSPVVILLSPDVSSLLSPNVSSLLSPDVSSLLSPNVSSLLSQLTIVLIQSSL